ncbi:MAG: alpha/beta hydrolase, partial [Opitutaceae bacterium]
LHVSVPSVYETEPDKKYPVLYICGGYWDFTLINGFYGNLIYDRVVPHFIIVGFGYPGDDPDYGALRRYDYTPVPAPDDPNGKNSGHAAGFLSVIERELIPFIEREYRADPACRVLGGSSLGGLFTLYALLEKPGLFQAYIAPSPAANWAEGWLFDFEKRFADNHTALEARLFMTGAGEEWPDFLDGIKRFHEQLGARGYDGFVYKWRLIDGERHAGTKAESYNCGIRFAFEPLAPKEE